jgi:hypothetical protein
MRWPNRSAEREWLLGKRQEVAGVLEGGGGIPAGAGRYPKPVEHGEMQWGPDYRGLGHEPIGSLQRGDNLGIGVAFAGHQRLGQGDVDVELQLFALASFGWPVQQPETSAQLCDRLARVGEAGGELERVCRRARPAPALAHCGRERPNAASSAHPRLPVPDHITERPDA